MSAPNITIDELRYWVKRLGIPRTIPEPATFEQVFQADLVALSAFFEMKLFETEEATARSQAAMEKYLSTYNDERYSAPTAGVRITDDNCCDGGSLDRCICYDDYSCKTCEKKVGGDE